MCTVTLNASHRMVPVCTVPLPWRGWPHRTCNVDSMCTVTHKVSPHVRVCAATSAYWVWPIARVLAPVPCVHRQYSGVNDLR